MRRARGGLCQSDSRAQTCTSKEIAGEDKRTLNSSTSFSFIIPCAHLIVTCECAHAWDLRPGMEHGKDLAELLIIDDGVRPVLVGHPAQEVPMQIFT